MECKVESCKCKATYGFTFGNPEYCMTHGKENGAKTQYGVCVCGSSTPRFAAKDERASCCGKCKKEGMTNIADRRCKCGNHMPSYGMPEDKRADYCTDCKKEGMVNLKNKKCMCGKAVPCFGIKGDKARCCKLCKKEGMINLSLELCTCGKSAAFGFKGDNKPTYCFTCKKDGMENIVTKKCPCGTVPVFGKPGDTVATCCVKCKKEGMVNVAGASCKCGKSQPVFGLTSDKRPTCCASCKADGMVDIRTKKCKCGKAQPVFGLRTDKKASCCVSCKTSEMVNIKAKMCKCGRAQPVFGHRSDKKATCCVSCKEEGMIDIRSQKCLGLIDFQGKGKMDCPYDHRAKEKYSNYCTLCFEQNFPDDPRTALIRKNSYEIEVKNFLAEHYNSFIHNTSLWTGQADCTCRRRIDFRTMIGNTLLCIEVDESQHKYRNTEDEELRYDDLMMLHGGKFIFIRFNPHLYINDEGERKNPEMATRLRVLKEEIDRQVERILEEDNDELLEVIHLYYDEC